MQRFLYCFAALMLLAGCAQKGGIGAFDGVSGTYPEAVAPVARDAAGMLAGFYPPGGAGLTIDQSTPFGQALGNAARQRGFMLSEAGIPVRYLFDSIEGAPGTAYLRLGLPGNHVVSRSYSMRGGDLSPAGSIASTGSELAYSERLPDGAVTPLRGDISPALAVPALAVSKGIHQNTSTSTPTIAPVAFVPAPPVSQRPTPAPAASKAPVAPKDPVPAHAVHTPITPEPRGSTATAPKPIPPMVPAVAVPLSHKAHSPTWSVSKGPLREQLDRWAGSAGYKVVWRASSDFDLSSEATFTGDFLSAVKQLFTALHMHGNPLRVEIYEPNHVIEVNEN